MRITKTIAENVAKKMIEKRTLLINKLELDLKKWVSEKYLKSTPKQILEAYEKYPEWFHTTTRVSVKKEQSAKGIETAIDVVPAEARTWSCKLILNKTDLIQFEKKLAEINKEKASLLEFRKEVEIALLNLRTYKRIEEELPEAKQFLPATSAFSVPALNYSSLNKKIKSVAA